MLPLIRLLQISDSAFPIGGYAYSHGLEWLAAQDIVRDRDTLAALLDDYIDQSIAGQALPACHQAHGARSLAHVARVDHLLDASITAPAEREAGQAMGERLLAESRSFAQDRAAALLEEVRTGRTPGQLAVALGVVARDLDIPLADTLSALGYTLANSVVQAALRLGVLGQSGAVEVLAAAGPRLASAVELQMSTPRRMPGAFTPSLDVAGLLHATLRFRMFAS